MSIRRSIGYTFLKPMIISGFGPTKIYNMLKAAGVGYRKQTMLADIRELTGRLKMEPQVKSLSGNRVVPEGWMTETELRRPYKYRIHGEAHWYDFEQGDEVIREASFYTDDLMKKEDWEKEFVRRQRESPSPPEAVIMSFHVKGVEHNKGFGY